MKTMSQIAKETGIDRAEIDRIVRMLEIVPTINVYYELDRFQEELVHNYLYFCGKFDTLTIESKMNYETI